MTRIWVPNISLHSELGAVRNELKCGELFFVLGIIWSNGEEWNQTRRFTVKKLRDFGFGKARTMEETIQEEADSLLDHMERESQGNVGIWRVDSNRLSAVALNILWSSVGGYRFDPESQNIKKHIALNTELFEKVLRPTNLLSVFPFLKIFPKLSGYDEHGEIHKRCREFMKVRFT